MSMTTALALTLSLVSQTSVINISPASDFVHVHGDHCATIDESHSQFGLKTLQERMQSDFGAMSASASAASGDNPTVLRIAVWYRPGWANAIGEQEIDRRVARWFDLTNQAFRNSNAHVRIEPAFVREMAYEFDDLGEIVGTFGNETLPNAPGPQWMAVPPGSSESWLPDDYPMYHRQTHAYGADHWLWIQEAQDSELASGPLGIAAVNGAQLRVIDQASAPFYEGDPEGIEKASLNTARTIAHELGHNLGLMHQFAADGESEHVEPDSYASSCGFGNVPGTATTIMWTVGSPRFLTRLMFSNPEIEVNDEACGNYERENQARVLNVNAPISATRGTTPAIVGSVRFARSNYIAGADWDVLTVDIVRDGDLSVAAEIEVTAFDGTAIQGVDFEGVKQIVKFGEGQSTAVVEFPLLNTDSDTTRTFDLKMQYPLNLDIETEYALATIQGVDDSGWVGDFAITPSLDVAADAESELIINRTGTTSGEALLKVTSIDGSAKAGVHYQAINQVVRFLDGETEKRIAISGSPVNSTLDFTVSMSSESNVNLLNGESYIRLLPGSSGEAAFSQDGDVLPCRNSNSSNVCTAEVVFDEAINTVTVEVSRLYGSSGELDIIVRTKFDESFRNGGLYFLSGSDVNESEQTVSLKDGDTSGVVTFEVIARPEDVTRVSLGLEIDDGSDKQFFPHPASYYGVFTLQHDDDDCDGGDCNGDDGGDDGDDGEGNPPPVTNPPPTNDTKTKASSVNFMFILMLLFMGLGIKSKARND